MSKETILQFGTGNFLRGFVCAFVDEMNRKGLYDGKIVVCQNIPGGSAKRLEAQDCRYHLLVRGVKEGGIVNEQREICAISRALNPYDSYEEFLKLAENPDLRFIVSNTTEAGIAFDEKDALADAPQRSFPGKLTALLYRRFCSGLAGFVLLPCELIDHNADELKACVLRYAELWALPEAFAAWVERENRFCNTLVDRIVTGYDPESARVLLEKEGKEDKLLDSAEAFALWVIEGNFEDELPLAAAGVPVVWADDVSPYKVRKVRLLNGGHTSMVAAAILSGLETVGECCADPVISKFMHECIFSEILPTVGMEHLAFANAVLDRFFNPFIRHRLLSIALNSVSKWKVRVLPSIAAYQRLYGALPKALTFSLAALIAFYRTEQANDLPEVKAFMKTASVTEILHKTAYWEMDLGWMEEAVTADLAVIEEKGMKGALIWLLGLTESN